MSYAHQQHVNKSINRFFKSDHYTAETQTTR